MPPTPRSGSASGASLDLAVPPSREARKNPGVSGTPQAKQGVGTMPPTGHALNDSLPRSSLARTVLHKPGLASIGTVGNSGPALAPKYAKIQPAIAIKPRPIAPESNATENTQKSTFNPHYDPLSSPALAVLKEDLSAANINLLKEWVLPPRPRPGRKPIIGPGSSNDGRKPQVHKKHKRLKREFASESKRSPAQKSKNAGKPALAARTIDPDTLYAVPALDVSPERVSALQKTYLAKLKEQELIQNYIDILSDQIQELRFVQSGVIAVSALNTQASGETPKLSSLALASSPPPSDQLDHINNVRDLDAFLAHLTTQSNVIHNVIKKFVGNSSLKEGLHVQLQIKQYLELRRSHGFRNSIACDKDDSNVASEAKTSTKTPARRATKLFSNKVPKHHGTARNNKNNEEIHPDELSADSRPNSFFASGFLLALDLNLFEQENRSMSVDVINERHPLSGNVGAIDRRKQGAVPEGEVETFNGTLAFQQLSVRGSKKVACVFCSAETPCLCFDAETVFGDRL